MTTRRLVAVSLVRLIVVYALLMIAWPGAARSYGWIFRTVGEAAFGSFGRDGQVRLEAGGSFGATHDTDLVVMNRRTGGAFTLGVSSRYFGYVPTAFLTALIAATPLPWRRRGRAMIYGLLLIHAWVAVNLMLMIVYGFSFSAPPLLYDLPDIVGRTLAGIVQVVLVGPINWLVVPLFVWLLVTFRRGDVATMLDTTSRASKRCLQAGERQGQTRPPRRGTS